MLEEGGSAGSGRPTAREVQIAGRAGVPRPTLHGALMAKAAATTIAVDPGNTLLDPMRRRLVTLSKRPPRLAASALGDRAVVTGAVRLALDHAIEHLLG